MSNHVFSRTTVGHHNRYTKIIAGHLRYDVGGNKLTNTGSRKSKRSHGHLYTRLLHLYPGILDDMCPDLALSILNRNVSDLLNKFWFRSYFGFDMIGHKVYKNLFMFELSF